MSAARGITGADTISAASNDAVLAGMPRAVAAFYRGFFAGDVEAVVALLHPASRVRFPSYPVLRGPDAARGYFAFQEGVFGELEFQLVEAFTEGGATCVVWREAGRLASGDPWRCHGVDVFEERAGLIARLDVGGSAWPLRHILPRYDPSAAPPAALADSRQDA